MMTKPDLFADLRSLLSIEVARLKRVYDEGGEDGMPGAAKVIDLQRLAELALELDKIGRERGTEGEKTLDVEVFSLEEAKALAFLLRKGSGQLTETLGATMKCFVCGRGGPELRLVRDDEQPADPPDVDGAA